MEQEAAQELVDRQGHQSLLVAVSGISPAEGDVTVGESNEAVVGDGDPMGIGTEIAQRMFRATEWSLGVNDPVITEQQPEPGWEGSRFGEWDESAMELEPAFVEGGLELGNKLTAEETTEHLDGKKERAARGDPAGVVWSESAGSKHAVDMGMIAYSGEVVR